MTRVLITGSSGQVGSRLAEQLARADFEVIGTGRRRKAATNSDPISYFASDLLVDDPDLLIKKTHPDLLIHLAWETEPATFWESPLNSKWLEASIRLAKSFGNGGGKKIVVAGTCAEYDWDTAAPHTESDLVRPATPYGKAKLDFLDFLQSQSTPFLWARTFFQFGGGESVGRLIPSLIDNLKNGVEFTIKRPDDIRDFIYIDDVVEIMKRLILAEANGVFNVASGTGRITREVAEMIASKVGSQDLLHYQEQSEKPSIVLADMTKLRTTLGPIILTPIEDAIEATIRERVTL